MMNYSVSFAIVLCVVVYGFAVPAAADDQLVCFDETRPPDTAIAACSALISSGKFQSHDLAAAYNRRGYLYLKKGESDRALADLSEAIRLDQNGSVWTCVTANWAIIIGAIGAAVGWYLTYRGWAIARENNSALEREKYQNAIDLEQRKAKLIFVSDQIRYLYGPLMALCKTRRAAFNVLMREHGMEPDGTHQRGGFFDGTKRSSEELRQWRLWRTEVLMPIVEKMQEAILKSAHLIEGETMPASFLGLMAHVASYKAVIKNWVDIIEKGEKDEEGILKIDAQKETKGEWEPLIPHTAEENFPEKALLQEVEGKLKQLEKMQAELIERIQA